MESESVASSRYDDTGRSEILSAVLYETFVIIKVVKSNTDRHAKNVVVFLYFDYFGIEII